MQVELEDYENGKPITLKTSADIAGKIKVFKANKQYDQLYNLSKTMPNNKQKYLLQANALLHLKKWKQLVECCDRGLDVEEDSDFYNLLGKGYGKLGDYSRKQTNTQKALEMNPKIPAYHRNLGAAQYKLKKYSEAVKSHDEAIKLEPKNSINYHNKGAALFRMKQLEEAKVCFKQAIQRDSKQVISHGWLGDTEKELKNYQSAYDHYCRAYELSSNPIYQKQKKQLQPKVKPQEKGVKGFFSKIFN